MAGSVCIVSPGNLASNPRLLKEADALHEAGYDVTAIACDYTEALRPFDDAIARRAPWKVVRVARPLAGRQASRAGGALARVLEAAGVTVPLRVAGVASGVPSGPLRRAAMGVPADLFIAHYVAALPAVWEAARRHTAMLGFDAEDFHSGESSGAAEDDFRMKMIARVEGTILPACVHVTAASPLIGKAYAGAYGVAPVTVLNVFPLDMAPRNPVPGGPPGRLRAYWFSQTIGLDRGLQAFLQAMALARAEISLDIRGSNRWGHGDTLMALARELAIADRVRLLPMAPPGEMVTLAASYDLGLSLETEATENRRLCLTNKIFTYLLAGVPALLSDTPAQRALAPDLGAAACLVSLADPPVMAQALDRLATSSQALAEARATAWQLGRQRYNWDVEKQALLASVSAAFERRTGGRQGRGRGNG